MTYQVVITGGGTGGHVFPGLAVAEELRERYAAEVVWVGSRTGIERRIVNEYGLPYRAVSTGKLRRYFSVHNLVDAVKVPAGIIEALVALGRLRPAVVFSKGGYVAVPVVVAARILGIPVVAHESDFDPGLATRISAQFAERILVAYDESVEQFAPSVRPRIVVTGNPVRKAIAGGQAARGRTYLGLSGERPVVLFLGGSLGSMQINEIVETALPQLLQICDVVHQTGEREPQRSPNSALRASHGSVHPGRYVACPFFSSEFADVLAAADVVVSRSGAGTIWENLSVGKASLLIPLGSDGSRGDQLRNAELCLQRGVAEVLWPAEVSAERLLDRLVPLVVDPEKRARLSHRARQLAEGDATGRVAAIVHEQVAGGALQRSE